MNDVQNCVQNTCTDSNSNNDNYNDCLIIAGHSQGGSIATVAVVDLKLITPNFGVYTFGAMPVVRDQSDDKCTFMEFQKHYRFNKALFKGGATGGASGLLFDKVSYLAPQVFGIFNNNAYAPGNFMVLHSDDVKSVAYVGFNFYETFRPWDGTNLPLPLGDAHALFMSDIAPDDCVQNDECRDSYYGIVRRMLESNQEKNNFPIQSNGFPNGAKCGQNENGKYLCRSNRCDRGRLEARPSCKSRAAEGKRCNDIDDCLGSNGAEQCQRPGCWCGGPAWNRTCKHKKSSTKCSRWSIWNRC